MSDERLLPCPFCGGEAMRYTDLVLGENIIECCDCDASTAYFKSKEEAIEAWNTRQAEPVTGKWIRPTMINGINFDILHCSVCGKVPCDTGKFCPECGAKMGGDQNE